MTTKFTPKNKVLKQTPAIEPQSNDIFVDNWVAQGEGMAINPQSYLDLLKSQEEGLSTTQPKEPEAFLHRFEIFQKKGGEWSYRESICKAVLEYFLEALEKYKKSYQENLNSDMPIADEIKFICTYTSSLGECSSLSSFNVHLKKEAPKEKVFLNGPKKKALPFPKDKAKHYAHN